MGSLNQGDDLIMEGYEIFIEEIVQSRRNALKKSLKYWLDEMIRREEFW